MMAERRKELGLTLEDVGKAVGVGKSTVRKWENGLIKNMGRDKIALIASVLQISPVLLVPSDKASPIPKDSECAPNRVFIVKDDVEIRLVTAYRGATDEIKSAALTILEKSAAENTPKKDSSADQMA